MTLFSHESSPVNGGTEAMWRMLQCMIAAGWTKVRDSDGTTYSATGTAVTNFGLGAGGLANSLAWVVLRAPGAVAGHTREVLVQRSSNTNWLCMYSVLGFSSGTAGTATNRPQQTDEQFLRGSGTAASPGFETVLPPDNTYKLKCICDSTAPYDVYHTFTVNAGTSPQAGWMILGLSPSATTTADPDPYVLIMPTYSGSNKFLGSTLATNDVTNAFKGWLNYGGAGAQWGVIPAAAYFQASTQAVPNEIGTNPATSKYPNIPLPVLRYSGIGGTFGWKGFLNSAYWRASTTTSTLATISVATATSKEFMVFGDMVIPWVGTDPI